MEWVARDGHWAVLGGDRRTAKTALIFHLADQCEAVRRPFVFSEELFNGEDLPWDRFPSAARERRRT